MEGVEHPSRDTQGAPRPATGADTGVKPSSMPEGQKRSSSWTDVLPKTEASDLFLSTDFSSTTLGPIESWGPALRCYTAMLFADNRAVCLYWGPDMISIYNDKFAVVCGPKHPALMGNRLYDFFPELRDVFSPMFRDAALSGQSIVFDEMLVFLDRHGYPEETYSSVQHIPVLGDNSTPEGFYSNVSEVTAQVLHTRRRRVLDLISQIPPLSVGETVTKTIEALRTIPYDIAAAMVYSFDEGAKDTPSLRLCGSIAIPENHRIAPIQADLDTCQDGLVPLFRQVHRTREMRVLRVADPEFQAFGHLLDGIDWCGYGEISREVAICPLEIGKTVIGFFFLGLGSRQHYNEATEQSINDLKRQVEAKWMASISKEEMDQRHAALEQRASESENKLRDMARNAPVGMAQIGPDMMINWANDQFYEITGHDRSKPYLEDWRQQAIPPEDQDEDRMRAERLLEGVPQLAEIRLARTWTPPGQGTERVETTSAWMLATGYPLTENGKVTLIMAYVTDISSQKWAQTLQSRNAAAALLAKRRQEEFIDVTCHEMRNPLSAITQLADGIETSMRLKQNCPTEDTWPSIAEEMAEAATTILSCAAHQKRVIDDVLMVSRLDSEMLTIAPVVCQANNIVTSTIRMFEAELTANSIEMTTGRHDSELTLPVDSVLLDPSRLTQLLINLITNAIKFTAPQAVRRISIVYGAHRERPQKLRTDHGELQWITPTSSHTHNEALPKLEDEEQGMYVYFIVQDTGPGISSVGTKHLFKRYSQESARTHISYGGTGLGLYICRKLAEKQGGSVGVATQHGKGSAFAFYVESRVVIGPEVAAGPPSREIFGSEHTVDNGCEDVRLNSGGGESEISFVAQVQTHTTIHVLLVEDNLINQKVMAKQLRKLDCKVTVANHGGEALKILETCDCWQGTSSPPAASPAQGNLKLDIILMDIEMPVMNGLECARAIRDLERDGQIVKKLPIIAVTANVRQEQKDLAIAAGMESVLSKPFTAAEVLTRMKEVLGTVG